MKKTLLLISCIFFSYYLHSQVVTELSGDIIYYDQCNERTNPVQNAFDGSTGTYFNSCAQPGNWIGMDLGAKHVITKIAFAPRMDADYRDRLQLGVFEGANNPDFGDAIALFIIPGLTERVLTEQEISCTRAFRYVRFVFPTPQQAGKSSYMSELKFYGYQAGGNDTKLPQLTNLPTISIHTVNTQDITSKEVYVKGIISVVYDNGTKIHTDSVEIRGRGNNSWTHPKKPYRIKLAKSTKLMDLPAKARNWTLINNYGDKTLMRNMIAFDFSRRLEMPYTSVAEAVDVVLNGDYKGCYQLCDHIDVRKNRVDIEEMTIADLTGGYMVEIDAYASEEPKKFTSSRYSIPVTIKYPGDDEITVAQENYIAAHFNKLTNAVYSKPLDSINKYMDKETFLRHFLVGEFSGNTDTYWSVRMTKQKDEDQFRFGPVWDFDLGFENDHRTYPINAKSDWVCFYTGGYSNGSWQNGSSAAGNTRDFLKKLFTYSATTQRLSEIYAYYRDRNIISKEVFLSIVDEYAAKLNQSQQLNFKRWPIMNVKVHENPVIHGSYEAEVANVKNYISGRFDWMDNKLSYVPNPVAPPITVSFHKPATWTQVYLKAWLPENNGSVPGDNDWGVKMTHKGNNWYTYTLPEGLENVSLLFSNNGNEQTATVTGLNEDACFATTGKWAEETKYEVAPADCETGISKEPKLPITVSFHKPATWTQVYVKAWLPANDNESVTGNGEWGVSMTATSNGWYSYTLPRGIENVSLLFSDYGNNQTATITGLNNDACFTTTGKWAEEIKYEVAPADCETGTSKEPKLPITVSLHKPATWTQVYIKAWLPANDNESVTGNGEWGVSMTATSDGWYSYTLPRGIENVSLLFSDYGNNQTVTITGLNNDACFATTGKWAEETKYEVALANCETGTSKEPKLPITVGFHKPATWTQVYIKAWLPANDNESVTGSGEWGVSMTATANGWYSYTLPRGIENVSLLFSDYSSKQTTTIEGLNNDACFATTGEWAEKIKYEVAPADCETGVSAEPKPIALPITICFNKPASWAQVYIKAWLPDDDNESVTGNDEWGVRMAVTSNNWYSHTLPEGLENVSLLFSDYGTTQTTIVTGLNNDVCFATTGKWAEETKYEVALTDCETGISKEPKLPITISFHKPASWTQVYLKAWLPDDDNEGVTGSDEWDVSMAATSNGWYSYTLPRGLENISLLFSDYGSKQTTTIDGLNEDACFVTTGEWAEETKYDVAIADCETGISKEPKPIAPPITICFHKPASWTQVYLKAWLPAEGNESVTGSDEWGVNMTSTANGWYSHTLPKGLENVSLLFSDYGNRLTTIVTGLNDDACFATTGEWAEETKYEVALADCENGVSREPLPTSTEMLYATQVQVYSKDNSIMIVNVLSDLMIDVVDITGRVVMNNLHISADSYINVGKGIYLVVVTDKIMGTQTYKCVIP